MLLLVQQGLPGNLGGIVRSLRRIRLAGQPMNDRVLLVSQEVETARSDHTGHHTQETNNPE